MRRKTKRLFREKRRTINGKELSFRAGAYIVHAKLENYDGAHPEIWIAVKDPEGNDFQDICMIRNKVVLTSRDAVLDTDPNTVEVVVYSNKYDEEPERIDIGISEEY